MKNKKPIKKKCDDLWSEIIKLRANFICEKCGLSGKVLNSHHIIGRVNLHLRYDLKNGICLCYNCHKGRKSAHENPVDFMDWLDADRPDWLDYLRKEQNTLAPNFDYEECIEKLKKALDTYKN